MRPSPLRDGAAALGEGELPTAPMRPANDFVPARPVGTAAQGAGATSAGAPDVTIGNVTTSISVQNAEATLAGARPKLRACYDQALARDASARGKLMLRVRVDAAGAVTAVDVALNAGLPDGVGDCAAAALRTVRFAPQPGRAPSDVGVTIAMGRS